MSAIFITGTDTGCGKTVVSAGLVKAFTSNDINCGYMKPISCGPKSDNDAVLVKKLCNLKDPISEINPIALTYPSRSAGSRNNNINITEAGLSPLASAKRAKVKISISRIMKSYSKLTTKYSQLIIEGVGGALVPIIKDYMVADLIKDLKTPTIIVARAGLGTLNHTFLTIEALRKRKIKILGIIMNGYTGAELSEKDNAEIIEEISGIPILAKLKWRK